MRPQLKQGQIRAKVSTMPRQKTEAAAYLDIYKLVNEKKRLQLELQRLDDRRQSIQQRLQALDTQVLDLEAKAHELRDDSPLEQTPKSILASAPKPATTAKGDFNTLFLEY